MADVLLIDRADGVATLTMNRPESMNALSTELKDALVEALAAVGADDSVRAVV
ncbi:MAG: 2-(1,2-epoxy,2-dihydrophenyl)acetyl-CoA isomerase, partial [Pseudonocardiales bacterium]|nr:2-(1,2-epoxy,2-dihydrophenyl)acetyl-CoA isomerase [Pseudonocardiales bacterium]